MPANSANKINKNLTFGKYAIYVVRYGYKESHAFWLYIPAGGRFQRTER